MDRTHVKTESHELVSLQSITPAVLARSNQRPSGKPSRFGLRRWLPALPALVILCASPAQAAVVCGGSISYLGLGPSGLVFVNNGFGVWYLCDVSAPFSGYSPEGCRAIYAALLTARATERSVNFYFDAPAGASCTSFGNWATPSPVPYHFSVN